MVGLALAAAAPLAAAQTQAPAYAPPDQHLFSPVPLGGASSLTPAPEAAPPAAESAPPAASPKPAPAPRHSARPPAAQQAPAPAPAAVPLPVAKPPAARQAATPPPAPPPPARIAPRPIVPLAVAASATTPAADANAVKQVVEALRQKKQTPAGEIARSIGDPLARKLAEWIVLRDDDSLDHARYAAFAAANPSWPSVALFRRRAEAALWQDRADAAAVRAYFANTRPLSAKGRLALARALLAQGDRAGAQVHARAAWRQDELSAELEKQAFAEFGALFSASDHQARMDRALYAENADEGLRAAQRLGGVPLAIARARAAVIRKAGNAGKLLDAVPAEGRRDAGYVFSRIQWLRRNEKIADAAQLMLAAPREPAALTDPDEWWTERKLVARKLLDLGDARTAYLVVRDGAEPGKGESRVDRHFTPGWIALRFLNDAAAAAVHFARIAQVTVHPAGLARAGYWQGRAAEAAGRQAEAKRHYEEAARHATAYYGQLARARIGLTGLTLNAPLAPTQEVRAALARLEIVRAVELLYGIGERDLVVPVMAEIVDKTNDQGVLTVLAEIAARNDDARAQVLLGRAALARGLPFDTFAYPVTGLPRYTPVGPPLDPAVAYAIARQESGFHPRAVSRANALGLMQVTPAAGRDIARRHKIAFSQNRLLDDPVYNMQLGAAELAERIQELGGSFILAFVAYNAGPRRVSEWTQRYGDPRDPKVDPVDWVERIPFTETRSYVQRVLENLQIYRVRFGGAPQLLIEADLRRGMAAN
jgi:soluble lytic murein transglycosylase